MFEEKLALAAQTNVSMRPLVRDESRPPIASLVQQGLWAMEQIEAGTSRLNVGITLSFQGQLDVAAMERALSALVARHDALRARFYASSEGELQVETMPPGEFALPAVDLSGIPSSEREANLQVALHVEVNRPFLLDSEDLIRGILYQLDKEDHVLQLTIHHLVIDGWGVEFAFRDLAELYHSALTGKPANLPDLPVRFADFAHWQREQLAGPEGERLLAFWLEQLAGAPTVLSLPTDRPRPAYQTFRGKTQSFPVPDSLTASIQECCEREDVTPFMILLAAVYSVFAKYTGQKDILVGSPVDTRRQIETEQIVGCFTNTIVLRGQLGGDPSFHDLLHRVRKTALDAFAHQDLPFDVLKQKLSVDRDSSRAPVVQVLVIYQNSTLDQPHFDGLGSRIESVTTNSSKVDLTIKLSPREQALEVDIEYNIDLFDSSSIDRLWSHLETFLTRAIASPAQEVAAISLHTAAQRQQLLMDWNQTQADYPREVSLAALVEAQVERTPQAIAVICGDGQLTFAELNERANQFAHHLLRQGAGPDKLVGVCLNRSLDTVVALLAIIKTGGAYLPIDPLLPPDRIQYLIEDSGVSMIVSEQQHVSYFPSFHGMAILMEDRSWRDNPRDNPGVGVDPTSLAYLIYTSGSTGKPKGVQIPRGAFTNLLWSMRNLLQLTEADRVLAVTTISFDIAGSEIWLSLIVGARMVMATREDAGDGKLLLNLIRDQDVTFMQATPITWQLLFTAGWKQKLNMQAVCGGEAMPPELAAQLVPAVKRLWNLYGPTETTVWSTAYVVTDPGKLSLIGRPFANTLCYILDSERQPVPIGITGDLYIAGDGLATGYHNRPELNAASFVDDPFQDGAKRMYRTGDLARYRADGNIECLGRIDHQVKLRGYRIELGEIEAALKDIPEITEAVVTLREDLPGNKRLVAYIVCSSGIVPETTNIVRLLRTRLPYYMVPEAYQTLAKLPVSPTGKIDRKALPVPQGQQLSAAGTYEAPRGPVQEILAQIWSEVLEVPRVGIFDDYFDLGGDSFRAVRLILKIRQAFPESRPSLATFLRAPTIERFAGTLTGGDADWSCLVPVREGVGRPPFFCVHGAGGNWMSMRALAMAMPSDQPFYCLQARGLDGRSAPFATVEETAACYNEYIRSVQPHGPYNLGGGCYGGLVAFEMACQLRSAGERVDVVALIDATNYASGRHISKSRLLYFKLSFLVRRTFHHLRQLEATNPSERRHYLWQRFKIGWRVITEAKNAFRDDAASNDANDDYNGRTAYDSSGDDFEENLDRIREASLVAARTFVPKPYDGQVMVFRAKQRPDEPYLDAALGWGPVVFGGVTVHEIDADHNNIFEPPAVSVVAELLDGELYSKELAARYRAQTSPNW